MRAFVYREYGGPEKLRLETVETPEPGPGEVLVQIRAAAINAADYRMLGADPFLIRLMNGLFRPKKWTILGSDLAGVVAATGAGVTGLAEGDAVFGEAFPDGLGSFAEFKTLNAPHLASLPEEMSFEAAAALPLAGITSLQAVRDLAEVREGDSVLVHGAGGGVGTLLVQIAKAYGALVTALCGPKSVDLVRELGADRVLDYTKEHFAPQGERYDAIFGVNGYRRLAEFKRALAPGGIYVMIGGTGKSFFDAIFKGKIVFATGGRRMATLTIDKAVRQKDLRELTELCESGKLRPVIDRVFPFDELPRAMEYALGKHVKGKVLLRMR